MVDDEDEAAEKKQVRRGTPPWLGTSVGAGLYEGREEGGRLHHQ
jgi:hypothetical protein